MIRKIKLESSRKRRERLTAKDHRRGEEYHSPGQRIQAASLISEGLPTIPPIQTFHQHPFAAPNNCYISIYPPTVRNTPTCEPVTVTDLNTNNVLNKTI